ncbi:MAG: hypothetical protein FE78DRAFT_26394 [Acidomyces sp. 'richmondensis']|nr:MAG: hypothetical protein FE78DRAFT_26394 [Acidomyces sp. 'richmondensis']
MNLALAGVERIKSRGEAASTANNDESNAMRLVLSCEFPSDAPDKKIKPSSSPDLKTISRSCLAVQTIPSPPLSKDDKQAEILNFMERADIPHRQFSDLNAAYQPQDALELIDHFENHAEHWLGSPTAQSIIQQHGFELALNAPYLMHAILAISAKHLSHLYPAAEKYRVAATVHYTRSLQAYSAQLVYDIDHGNANALLGASGLLAKLSFINTPTMSDEKPTTSGSAPAWIRSMQGVKTLFQTPKLLKELENGMMTPLLRIYSSAPSKEEFLFDPQDQEIGSHTFGALKKLCDIDASPSNGGTKSINPFGPVLDRLEPLMMCKPTHAKIDRFMAFIALAEPSFIELLVSGEPRAMLILAFWCARFSLVEQWWTGPPARNECKRLCAHLSKIREPTIQALLRSPAMTCGYELPAHVQELSASPKG